MLTQHSTAIQNQWPPEFKSGIDGKGNTPVRVCACVCFSLCLLKDFQMVSAN